MVLYITTIRGYFSSVLLALCDANYCFTTIDYGEYGSNNDAGILLRSEIKKIFEEATTLPEPVELEGCHFNPLPFFLLGDEILPLKPWLLKPYPGTNLTEEKLVYNYRLSRCRRVIESTFGILVARWRILSTTIRADVKNIENYVLACIALHNYLRKTENASYVIRRFILKWRRDHIRRLEKRSYG